MDPLNKRSFRNNFDTHIESKFRDQKILLCLLVQYREAKIKGQMEYVLNEEIGGYGLALNSLERKYSQPCVIADSCERRLRKFVCVKSNYLENLGMFADLLKK